MLLYNLLLALVWQKKCKNYSEKN